MREDVYQRRGGRHLKSWRTERRVDSHYAPCYSHSRRLANTIIYKGHNMCRGKKIDSVEAFIKETKTDYEKWGLGKRPWFPWFRGEPDGDTPLVPKLFRSYYKSLFDGDYYENRLLQHFRTRALAYGRTPHRDETDQWLFLARHVGLPTRLLDWTGSALAALYFALQEEEPIVWMLNPFCLNNMVVGKEKSHILSKEDYNIYALTWYPGDPKGSNIAYENIRCAWETPDPKTEQPIGTTLPVAISPTYIHPRIPAQKGYFTIHGRQEESLCTLIDGKEKYVLKKYVIDAGNDKQPMLDQLEILGVSETSLFPELDGLAKGLTELFRPDLATWIQRRTQQSVNRNDEAD